MLAALAIITVLLSVSYGDEKVRYAAVIYRHGDRTPITFYPTDPYSNQSLWPVKFGELTNTGKRQHYAFGQWLRKRYSHLLSSEFEPSEIYVRSTDVDRTLMSAQTNLAGMYPPSGDSVWVQNLPWQPIPIHTEPEKEDKLLAMKKHCSKYNMALDQYFHSKEYKEKLIVYQELMNYLTAYTGMKVTNFEGINDIYNILYIESLYNFTLPNWTHTVYPDKLVEPAGYSFRVQTATPLLARLKVGPLLKHIVSQMVKVAAAEKSNKKEDHLKLSMFSGHDLTVANVLNVLNMYDGVCPTYTSTVFLELLYDNSTTPLIRISYRNSTELIEPHVLYIPNCGKTCPLERFIRLYENLLTVNWDYECEKQFPALLTLTFFCGLGVFFLLYAAYQLHFSRVYRQHVSNMAYSTVATRKLMSPDA